MFNRLSAALLPFPRRLLVFSAASLTRACGLVSRMQPAEVRCVPGEPKLTISFCLDGSQKRMLREQDEALGKALARISNNLVKGQGKAKRSKRNTGQQSGESQEPTVVKLYLHGAEVHESVPNSEAWQDGAVLQVGGVRYSVLRNPPTFTVAELPVSLLAGFPVCPKLEMEFGKLQDCEFSWYREDVPKTG